MDNDVVSTRQRLENIKSIKPLLIALRTISLSNWKMTLRKQNHLKSYLQDLQVISNHIFKGETTSAPRGSNMVNVVVFGSTRGLCGSFNRDLFEFLQADMAKLPQPDPRYYIFGEKMSRIFHRKNIEYRKTFSYPRLGEINRKAIIEFLSDIQPDHSSAHMLIFYNAYRRSSRFEPDKIELHPPPPPIEVPFSSYDSDIILDSDPEEIRPLLHTINQQLAFFEAMLSSLAAENSLRYQMMENALTNTDKLILELTVAMQVERQMRVTNQMRELSVSAGLLQKS